MQDPNIIATLIATTSLTERAFQLDHNDERYRAPTSDAKPFSRENTPYPGEDPKDEDDCEHQLKLSFDKPPKM
jgi:hypothetical protein